MKDNLSAPLKCLGLLSRYLKCRRCFLDLGGLNPDCDFWQWLKLDYSISKMETWFSPYVTWITTLVVLDDGQRIPIRLELDYGSEGEILMCDSTCCNREQHCEPIGAYRPGVECCRQPWDVKYKDERNEK